MPNSRDNDITMRVVFQREPMASVARSHGVSRARVHQIACKKLRRFFISEEHPRSVEFLRALAKHGKITPRDVTSV